MSVLGGATALVSSTRLEIRRSFECGVPIPSALHDRDASGSVSLLKPETFSRRRLGLEAGQYRRPGGRLPPIEPAFWSASLPAGRSGGFGRGRGRGSMPRGDRGAVLVEAGGLGVGGAGAVAAAVELLGGDFQRRAEGLRWSARRQRCFEPLPQWARLPARRAAWGRTACAGPWRRIPTSRRRSPAPWASRRCGRRSRSSPCRASKASVPSEGLNSAVTSFGHQASISSTAALCS